MKKLKVQSGETRLGQSRRENKFPWSLTGAKANVSAVIRKGPGDEVIQMA